MPGRNLVFLTFAAAYAYQRGIANLITGVAQTDYSGYPDCRENTITSLQHSIRLGMEFEVNIFTPLMHLSKKETVELRITSYNVCYTKLLRLESDALADQHEQVDVQREIPGARQAHEAPDLGVCVGQADRADIDRVLVDVPAVILEGRADGIAGEHTRMRIVISLVLVACEP